MPGMIAAVMIGFGRAAGETMILLILSGNTGVIDVSVFEGLRSVSASLALELPEAPRNSSHYFVLFVMGLLLFASTFAINTAAELIKDRRKKREHVVSDMQAALLSRSKRQLIGSRRDRLRSLAMIGLSASMVSVIILIASGLFLLLLVNALEWFLVASTDRGISVVELLSSLF